MSTDAPGAAVFAFADDLLQSAVLITARQGESGGFWQVFDATPDDENSEPEIHRDLLDRASARSLLQRRAAAGFDGIVGFCCLEVRTPRLYVEAFDTRRNVGIALGGPLRRTLLGKYKPASGQAEILGAPVL